MAGQYFCVQYCWWCTEYLVFIAIEKDQANRLGGLPLGHSHSSRAGMFRGDKGPLRYIGSYLGSLSCLANVVAKALRAATWLLSRVFGLPHNTYRKNELRISLDM